LRDKRRLEERILVDEARLEAVDSGLTPASEGWFIVNLGEAAWLTNDAFGGRCVFEADVPVVRSRPELEPHRFADVGFTLAVIEPGKPSGLYHAESNQESFLVLEGECLLLVEGEERRLRAWDFVHCPTGTEHVFVGTGTGPCVIFMAGARTRPKTIVYPDSDLARRYGAGVDAQTSSAAEAYAPFPHWSPGRPDSWSRLPWA
jgi:uncharacterized cupin superfamily protein